MYNLTTGFFSERRRSLEHMEHRFISIPSDQGVNQCDTTERGWRPDNSLWSLSRLRSSMRLNLLDSHVSYQKVGTKVPGFLDTRILSILTMKSFRQTRKTLARCVAHSFQKNKIQKIFVVVVAIDIGDISFFFLGLLLTLTVIRVLAQICANFLTSFTGS